MARDMHPRSLYRLAAHAVLAAALLGVPAQAMTFTLIEPVALAGPGPRPNHMILGEGPILPGDAEIFEAFMAQLPPTDIMEVQWGIALNSPGGVLPEGVRLGEAFRRHVVSTAVLGGHACESACAVAFLGGAAQYATAEGVMRLLQPGGRLGFHGVRIEGDTVADFNETLDFGRMTNVLVRDYAIRMGVGDDGLVQNLFNTPPDAMELIDTPAELRGLDVTLALDEIRPPAGWAVNLCRHAVAGMLQTLDPLGLDGRVADRADPLGSVEAFRRRLLEAKHGDGTGLGGELYGALARAPAATAIDVIAGRPLWLDQGAAEIWEVGLGRGAGFYYDSCFAVSRDGALSTIVVDGTSEVARVESFGALDGFPADRPLW